VLPLAAIDDIFSPQVLAEYERGLSRTKGLLRHRHAVLSAHGPYPSDPSAAFRLRCLRAERASWEAYVDAAAATGLLDDDLRGRLRGFDKSGFRSSLSECLACWLFAGKLQLKVTPRPAGRRRKVLDLRVEHLTRPFDVEAKAPKTEVPEGTTVWCGNDAPTLAGCLKDANEQFAEGTTNVLVVTSEFKVSVSSDRYQLVQAFIGEFALSFPVNVKTGASAGEAKNVFLPRGSFVRSRGRKPDGQRDERPAYTRVSAVVCIEERIENPAEHRGRYTSGQVAEAGARGDERIVYEALYDAVVLARRNADQLWIEHNVFVVHNPRAQRRLDESVFAAFPQFVVRDEHMEWTDGHPPIG
jgi:hypothetical protein